MSKYTGFEAVPLSPKNWNSEQQANHWLMHSLLRPGTLTILALLQRTSIATKYEA
ncbi:hypothetical protein KIH86_26445 [Paenibacillus sp. HN-1]|uniref:hypothetical protein n=1 Tax=Paenibacillus TaxID=44249 RepID=UPI001CA98C29|nr:MULTISPECIES: hypothetical protein [Paenibacillus]MBY9080193.1 hypothetical protein [Paenibacillus sp. CGMCC 1.18879]MBY9087733.1 hypothetical protein [Paenibacillus sinensis]